MMNRSIP